MRILVIGQGGREHAIVHALVKSPSVTEVHVIPGSDGIAQEAVCHNLDWKNIESLIQFCLRTEIDYVIVGPEDPLAWGLSDILRERGILVVGPSHSAAQLESSKQFAKQFMLDSKIPTSHFKVVHSVSEVMDAAQGFQAPFVLKADGLAAGKGVFICQNQLELKNAAITIFEKKTFGTAGESAVLEQFLPGWELSYLVLTNGLDFTPLPLSQDHKRLLDHDLGPNTGGMGTVAPLKIDEKLNQQILETIIKPVLENMNRQGLLYRGILYFGLMITKAGPFVLEFNCRLGDPETQVILPLVDEDWGLLFKEIATGKIRPIRYKNMFSTCVILAAPGYPDQPQKDVPIKGDLKHQTATSYFLHAGTYLKDNQWYTKGGRVLCSIGLGNTLTEALAESYAQTKFAKWDGQQMRTDIGSKLKSPSE